MGYLPLVKATVLRMKHNFPESYQIDDMYGVGARALVYGKPIRFLEGKSFGNYAALRIRALLDELRRLDYLPRSNRAKAKSLQFNNSSLENKLKRSSPSTEEVEQELSLSEGEYASLLKDTQPAALFRSKTPPENSGSSEDRFITS